MPSMIIERKNGDIIKVNDLEVGQIKELLGMNGYHSNQDEKEEETDVSVASVSYNPDYERFYASLSDKGRTFFRILKQNPSGIDSDKLAPMLDFKSGNQIGGLAGGSLGKLAHKFDIRIKRLYVSTNKFENGVRTRVYKPGRDIFRLPM